MKTLKIISIVVACIAAYVLVIEVITPKEPSLQEVVRQEAEWLPYHYFYDGEYEVDTVIITSHYAFVRMISQDTFYAAFDIMTERRYSMVHFCKCDFNWVDNEIQGCDNCNHSIISGKEFEYYRK